MRRRSPTWPLATTLTAAVLMTGCGGDPEKTTPAATTHTQSVPTTTPRPAPPPLEQARCPAGAGNCASATGRVIYVEKVDPDGDGDAHFVLLGGNVTGRGLSVIDVRRDLRPDPLPGVGDTISAAGPVYRGSYGQRQIEARELRVRRRSSRLPDIGYAGTGSRTSSASALPSCSSVRRSVPLCVPSGTSGNSAMATRAISDSGAATMKISAVPLA